MTLSVRESLVTFYKSQLSCGKQTSQLSHIDSSKTSYSTYILTQVCTLLCHTFVFVHIIASLHLPLLSSQWRWNEEKEEEKEDEWEEEGEEMRFWSHHPDLTNNLIIPCDLVHNNYSRNEGRVWEAKGFVRTHTAGGRISQALKVSLLDTGPHDLLGIKATPSLPTHTISFLSNQLSTQNYSYIAWS